MATQQRTDPAVHRRRLRSELRKLREAAGLTQRDVARAMEWSLSKLIRIETGAVSITTNDLKALLQHYAVTDPGQVTQLLDIARFSREKSWWNIYRDVAEPAYINFLGYEHSASIIRNFEPLLVPGLLQTEEYARELLQYIRGPKDPKRIDALVALRMERQELMSRADPPQLHIIIDEAVIRRVVGGPHLMRRQLLRMREATEQPNMTLRVVPFTFGMYRSLRVPYVLFEFADAENETVLFLEYPQEDMIVVETSQDENPPDGTPTPSTYLEIFWELEQAGGNPEAISLIDSALRALSE